MVLYGIVALVGVVVGGGGATWCILHGIKRGACLAQRIQGNVPIEEETVLTEIDQDVSE